ncbi:MAG: hypothetical protein HKO64_01940 [Xanthomonadales bacterium]|nr:hypothetical protein [Xanthomonadales bacterium]
MKRLKVLAPLGACLLALAAVAQAEIIPLSRACESALALSAGPANLREAAGVLVLGNSGYETVRASSNGFTCMVERNHELSLVPQCFDERSLHAHVSMLLEEGRKIRQGVPFETILEQREAGLENGQYKPASGPGIVYMISDFNYIRGPGGDVVKVAPHVMFHAPNLSHADIGSDPATALQNRGLPIIASEGPHGFMVSFTDAPSDSADVLAYCAGELPDASAFRPFPPPTAP